MVLATNQLQFVSMADVVVVMRGGTAVEVGSYPELLAAGGVFAALMKEAQVSRRCCGWCRSGSSAKGSAGIRR